MNQSYIKVLNAIGAFSQEHMQIKKFAADFPAQIPNFGNKDEEYPILFVSPSNSIFNLNTKTFDLTIYCFDLIQRDRDNINTILSDTNSILNDLVIWLQHSNIDGIDLVDSSTATPLNNSLLDYAAGWQMNITLEVDMYTTCEIPFLNYPIVSGISTSTVYDRLLTCESLPDCPVIQDIQEQLDNIAISGGTVNINGNIQPVMAPNEFRVSQGGTGVLTFGFGISANTTTSIKIAPITGYIVNNETNPAEPSFTYVNYSGNTNVPVTTLGTGIGSFVLLNSAGQPYFQNTFPTSAERKANIWLGKIAHPTGAITSVINEPDYIVSPMGKLNDFFQAINYINDGVYPYANGVNLTFNITGGDIHGNGINLHNSNTKPNEISMGPGIQQPFLYRTQTGGTASAGISIIPGSYDNGGVITSVGGGANSSTLQWIFCVPGAGFIVQYGQTVYSTLTNAIAAIGREQFVVFPNLVDNAILIGVLAVNKSATQLNNTAQAQFFRADKFGQIIGAQAGISTSTLQAAYDNSLAPQITTTSALGAFTLKGWDSGTASTFTILNTANTTTFDIKENGGFLASSDGTINGLTVGKGSGNVNSNTVLGMNALITNSVGSGIVAIGNNAFRFGTGSANTAIGSNAMSGSTTSVSNVGVGANALMYNLNGNGNVSIGADSGRFIADGITPLTFPRQSLYIGDTARSLQANPVNEIVIGQNATGLWSNSVVLGNDSITKTALKGNVLIGTTTDNGYKMNVSGSTNFNSIDFLDETTGLRISTPLTKMTLGGNSGYSWIQSFASKPLAINPLANNVFIGSQVDLGLGRLQIGGARPIGLDTVGGAVKFKAPTGGWAMGTTFIGSSGTDRGGFLSFGNSDVLSYYFIGSLFNNPPIAIRDNQGGGTGNIMINTAGVDNGIDKLQVTGSILATTIKKSGGTSSQFLMADGSVKTQENQLTDVTITGTSFTIDTNNTRYICTSSASTLATVASGITGNIEVLRYGTGTVAFTAGTGTTLRYATFTAPSISERYASAALQKLVSAGEIRLYGELVSI